MPTTTLRFLSGTNGFLPEATGQAIAYARRADMYPHLKYVQMVPAPQPVGVYAVLGRDEFVRVVSDEEFTFEDGDEAPQGQYNQIPFMWQEFRTYRRAYPWRLGYQAIETADRGKAFKPKIAHMAMAMNKAMTNRSNRIVKLITGNNWGSTHTATAVALNGNTTGYWNTSSSDPTSVEYLGIWKSLMEAARRIHLDTNGVVQPHELKVIIGPDDAIAISQAPEIVDYLKQQVGALKLVEEGYQAVAVNENKWNLPTRYKGFEFVVDDTVIVDTRPAVSTLVNTADPLHAAEAALASPGRHYAWPRGTAVITSRVGALDGEYGAPSFSTVQVFHHGGLLEVRAFDDPKNERVIGRVQENFVEKIVSNLSGFRITAIHS